MLYLFVLLTLHGLAYIFCICLYGSKDNLLSSSSSSSSLSDISNDVAINFLVYSTCISESRASNTDLYSPNPLQATICYSRIFHNHKLIDCLRVDLGKSIVILVPSRLAGPDHRTRTGPDWTDL
jgi:hypothetical protein